MSVLTYPDDLFCLRPGETPLYGVFPELRRGVQWFVARMGEGEWTARRAAAAKHFYETLVGEEQADIKGRYFNERDLFGWYLFQGEAFTDHPWNYEVFLGCHIVPVLATIGNRLDDLARVDGFEQRARRLLTVERNQPNGGLFELVVAAAYAREGWNVAFKPVQPGVTRTYDLDIERDGKRYAVECKRLEAGEYVEDERARMRGLWIPASLLLARHEERSAYCQVTFKVEVSDVPERYLMDKVLHFIRTRAPASEFWDDDVGYGVIGDLDLSAIQTSLKDGYLLYPGPVFNKLLTGSYRRYDTMLAVQRMKYGPSPHFVDDIDLAVVTRWSCVAEAAIDKRARDIQTRLVEANSQLPGDRPGIIHIGFEALSGDDVEMRRYTKILERVNAFDPKNSGLAYVYCHYFAPETSPKETWAMDETVQWMGIDRVAQPLSDHLVIVPQADSSPRIGPHWAPGPLLLSPRKVG